MRIILNSENLNKLPEDTIYFHVAPSGDNKNKKEYINNHIKNARFISFEDDLVGDIGIHGGRHPLPDMKKFSEKIMDFGVNSETPVLVYGKNSFTDASRLWWMLESIGIKNCHILYGTLDSYMYEGKTTESGEVLYTPSQKRDLSLNNNKLLNYEDVKSIIHDDKYIIIDSRDSQRYEGLIDPVDNHPGHIPSAINKHYEELLLGQNPPSIDDINNFFKDIDKDKNILLYCGSGVTAGANAIYLKEIGIEYYIYPGSYSDWITYPGAIIELGAYFGE